MHDDDPTTSTRLDEVPTGRSGAARYRFAHGAAGEVVVAHDEQLGRTVAIKRMREPEPSELAVQQFLREAQIQGRLDHPAIAPVYDVGRDADGRPYFAMRSLAGATLRDVIAAGMASPQRLLRAFVDACLAIEYAHARGVAHGALAAANLLLGDFGETYVLDWSHAQLLEGENPYRDAPASNARAADIFALGAILFEILAGVPPVDQQYASLRALFDRDVPPELDVVCAWALAPEVANRAPSARELADRVQQYLDGDRDLAQRRALAAAHLASALDAFERADRGTALREAARALALDPTQRPASELVTRIMVEPPPELPPEIAAAVELDNVAVQRRTARFVAIANFGFLAFVPLLLSAGKQHPVLVGMMCVLVAANAMLLAWAVRGGPPLARWLRLAISVALTALVTRIASPFLLGTPLAAVTTIGLVAATFHTTREVVIAGAAIAAGVIVPWIAEVAGWLPPSMFVEGSRLVIDSPMMVGQSAILGGLVLYTVVIVACACVLTRGLRISEGTARMQLHLQAWQLRQLVPS